MQFHIYSDPQEVNTALADFFVETCNKAIAEKGYANVVLSGGNSPKQLHQLLATEYRDKLQWKRISFFFGDERYVSFDSPDNNGAMAKRTLFDPLNIDESQVHYVNTAMTPEEAARDYSSAIAAHFTGRPVQFDFILLGLGDNVHTASLFPNTDVLEDKIAAVKSVFVEEIKAMRITMTAPLINKASTIAFLVYGPGKAEAVHSAIEGENNYHLYPAQLIKPGNGDVHWFMDEPAAALVRNQK
jgi:6-phosphogluconolactonase